MPFKEGRDKTGGRSKGTPNKTTEKARELFTEIMADQVRSGRVKNALAEVYDENRSKYLSIFEKLAKYFLPQKVDVTSGDESITGFLVKDASRDKPE